MYNERGAEPAAAWEHAVRVIDAPRSGKGSIKIHADTLKQKVVCYLEREEKVAAPLA